MKSDASSPAEILNRAVSEFGPLEAAAGPDGAWTYSRYAEAARQVTARLLADGFHPGHRLALRGAPCPEYLAAMLGSFLAGVTACPISTRLPAVGVGETLDRLKPRAIAGDFARTSAYPYYAWEDLLIAGSESVAAPPESTAAPATLLMTSGSSGPPKLAAHRLQNHLASARLSNANLPLRPGVRWLLSLPLYHVAGIGVVMRCILTGACAAIPRPDAPLAEAIAQTHATHVSLVPTQLARLLHTSPGRDALAHLKAVVLGGAPAPAGLIDAALAARVPLVTTYGLTETSSQICATHPGDPHEALYTSGRPLAPGCVRIAEGEIQVAGPTLFAGYWDGGELRLPRTEDGWFATGDLGHWDSGGRLVVRGRKDNLFISGGENIQPEEIEAELCRAEGVLRAVVVSRADPQWGARPVAFVETLPGRQFDPAAWEAALAERLPRFKLPVAYRPWPADLAGVKAPRAELSRRV